MVKSITTPTLTTKRLVLLPLELADAEAIQVVFPRWEIVRWMADHIPWPYPADGALTFVRDFALPAMREGVEWHWSIRPKSESQKLIGVISLMDQARDNRGFWLAPEWRRQGLMTEACEAVTDFWFAGLGRKLLQASKAVNNIASRRITERAGMRVVSTDVRNYISGPGLAELWEITAEEWWAKRRA